MKVTIDRFEDGYAVLLVRGQEQVHIDFPAELLPEGSREGDILDLRICRDEAGTEETRKRVSDLIEKLKKKNVD
jgi:hypothetical protein